MGPSLYFPATVQLGCCKASLWPCGQVATTNTRKAAVFLYVKMSPCVTTKSCVFPCRHPHAPLRGPRNGRERTPKTPGQQHQRQAPGTSFPPPLKPDWLANPTSCLVWPWTSASLQTQRQSKVCVCNPYSHNHWVLRARSTPRNISPPPQGQSTQTGLRLPAFSSAQPAANGAEGRPK